MYLFDLGYDMLLSMQFATWPCADNFKTNADYTLILILYSQLLFNLICILRYVRICICIYA